MNNATVRVIRLLVRSIISKYINRILKYAYLCTVGKENRENNTQRSFVFFFLFKFFCRTLRIEYLFHNISCYVSLLRKGNDLISILECA